MIWFGSVCKVLVISFEVILGYLEWCDCDCYFIFGDVVIVVLLEWVEDSMGGFEVVLIKCVI